MVAEVVEKMFGGGGEAFIDELNEEAQDAAMEASIIQNLGQPVARANIASVRSGNKPPPQLAQHLYHSHDASSNESSKGKLLKDTMVEHAEKGRLRGKDWVDSDFIPRITNGREVHSQRTASS